MIPIDKCLTILNKGERQYSREEAEQIRSWLYQIGRLQVDAFLQACPTQ
jgi:hypothetical protein